MLVRWGHDNADEHGIICALQASEAGEATYKNHGFEVVKRAELDVRPNGSDDTELRRKVIRRPKVKNWAQRADVYLVFGADIQDV